ncbi:hypothetical protein D3C75_805900 [compost metagenome]
MHRMAPAIAAVLDLPHFQGADAGVTAIRGPGGQLWRGTESARVHVVTQAAIGLDGPRHLVCAVRASEDEGPVSGLGQACQIGRVIPVQLERDHDFAFGLARFGRLIGRRVHGQVLAAVGLDVELQDLAHRRVTPVPLRALAGLFDHRQVLLRQHVSQGDVLFRTFTGVVRLEIDEEQFVARFDSVFGEVVETLGDPLGRQNRVVVLAVAVGIQVHAAVKRHRVLHDVAVVGDHVERHPRIRQVGAGRAFELATGTGNFPHHGELEVARHRAVEETETVTARTHLEPGFVLPVDQNLVSEEAVSVERVEP